MLTVARPQAAVNRPSCAAFRKEAVPLIRPGHSSILNVHQLNVVRPRLAPRPARLDITTTIAKAVKFAGSRDADAWLRSARGCYYERFDRVRKSSARCAA